MDPLQLLTLKIAPIQIGVINLAAGLALALIIAGAAYRLRALSRSGAIAAALMGMVIFGLGGLPAACLLLAFFISSSLLSRLFSRRKSRLEEKYSKGSRRDAGQVLANGGLAMLFILLGAFFPNQSWPWIGFAGSLAAANADTWATELGVLSPSAPRLITTGRTVERGTSGGISLVGTLAALGGAALVAILMVLFAGNPPGASTLALAGFSLAGAAGSLVDSWLGATVQAIYACPVCCKETERHPLHSCGTPTTLVRGWRWLNNDWVNVSCSLAGAALAIGLLTLTPAWAPMDRSSAATGSTGGNLMTFPISSSAFEEGSMIPVQYTCDGANQSPPLTWRDVPAGTRSLALIADDPDAPIGTYTHWVLYNVPPTITTLPEAIPQGQTAPGIGTQGVNSARHTGYDGPCPPPGAAHRYYFHLYALDTAPTLPAGLDSGQLRKEIQGHVIGEATWVGRYGR